MQAKLCCPTCSREAIRTRRLVEGTPVHECTTCGMIFMSEPAKKDLYSANYFASRGTSPGYDNYHAEFPAHYRSFQSRLKRTEQFTGRKGRHLDIGCALGHCGKAAKDLGWDTYVTDVSSFAAEEAAKKFGLRAFVSPPDKLPVRNGAFDCVTLFDVLEHVSDPVSFLKGIRRTISAKGVLQITTPDIRSLTAKVMGSKWYHFKPGEHFLYFSKTTLTRALELSGYKVLHVEALPMSMRIGDILKRLKKYWPTGFGAALKLAEKLNIADFMITLYAGEMQAWARPAVEESYLLNDSFHSLPDICHCPECEGTLDFSAQAAVCLSCSAEYKISSQVVNLSVNTAAHKRTA